MPEQESKIKTFPLLKVIVGSQAHGLATPESDYDYRAVYALPTSKILSLGFKYSGSQWMEGETEDNTSWEIGHFLNLALQCNPTILEVFLSPKVEIPIDENDSWTSRLHHLQYQQRLRDLFPFIWNPQKAYHAFLGYSRNQQKKFLDKKDNRPHKFAVAYIRTLVNLNELLTTGTFTVNLSNHPEKPFLMDIKRGNYTVGHVMDRAEELMNDAASNLTSYTRGATPYTDEQRYERANNFLLDVRKELFS